MNPCWPVQRWLPAEYLEYDWYSGLWEATSHATVRYGVYGFGSWIHAFLEPPL